MRSQLACTDGGRGAFAHIRLRTNLSEWDYAAATRTLGVGPATASGIGPQAAAQWQCVASVDADAAAIMAGVSAAPCQVPRKAPQAGDALTPTRTPSPDGTLALP